MVASAIFLINTFPPSKPGAGMSNKKGPGQIVLGTVVNYKKVYLLHPGKYVHLHQEDESWNTTDIDQTVRAIFLGPQYNLQGGGVKEASNRETPPDITLDPCQYD